MIRIAVCDDEPIMTEFICEAVFNEYSKYTDKFTVDSINNPANIKTSNLTCFYDIIFLDIDMPGTSGFDIAEKLNVSSPNTLIIFVTSHDELVYSSIKFKPFRFIRKTYLKNELSEAVKSSFKFIQSNKTSEKIKLQIHNGDVHIELNSIIYMEVYNHTILTHTDNGNTYECTGNLSAFEERLKDADFIRTHKSYLINCRFIYSIGTNNVTLDDNAVIPLSRYRAKDVKSKYLDYLRRN